MVWSFMQNARMYEALRDYGDRLDTVGIFTFEVDATIRWGFLLLRWMPPGRSRKLAQAFPP